MRNLFLPSGVTTAEALAVNGAHVVMANRNIQGTDTIKQQILAKCVSIFAVFLKISWYRYFPKKFLLQPEARVDSLLLDLSDLASVKKAADDYLAAGWPLHILILNAGVYQSPEPITKQGYESSFGVNHLGTVFR